MSATKQQYFATLLDDEFVTKAEELCSQYRNDLSSYALPRTWRLTYCQKYGMDPKTFGNITGAGVWAEGDSDGIDTLRLRTNLSRPLLRQAVIMALGERPSFQAVATNTDATSENQVSLVSGMLEYAATEADIDRVTWEVAEAAEDYGSGGWHVQWDPTRGHLVDSQEQAKDPNSGEPLFTTDDAGKQVPWMKPVKKKSGSIKLDCTFPWQRICDIRDKDKNWVIIKEPVNRYEFAALFPEKAEAILSVPSLSFNDDWELLGFAGAMNTTNDIIILHHFYHRNTAAVPGGRYTGYFKGVHLWTRKSPVQNGLPYVDVTPIPYTGTIVGHPEGADVAAQQETYDDTLSAVVTNCALFKDQQIFVKGDYKYDNEARVIKLPDGAEPPMTAKFQEIPAASKFLLELMPLNMQQTVGLNETAMGRPEGANMSGVAITQLTNTAIQLQKPMQLSVDNGLELVGNIMLEMIKKNASDGFVAEIGGASAAPVIRQFTQQDLDGIRRVKILRVNPLMNTFTGMMEVNKVLSAEQDPRRRRQLIEVMKTKSLEPLIEDDNEQTILIRWENEELSAGRYVAPQASDDPRFHFPSHRTQSDKIRMMPDSPQKQAALLAFQRHSIEHTRAWLSLDATMAEGLGIPLPKAKQLMLANSANAAAAMNSNGDDGDADDDSSQQKK